MLRRWITPKYQEIEKRSKSIHVNQFLPWLIRLCIFYFIQRQVLGNDRLMSWSWRLVGWSRWGKWLKWMEYRLPSPEDAEDKELWLWYTNTDILHSHNKKQQSQKCDQEPIFKIYWSSLLFSKRYADKQDDVCEVEASIPTGPWITSPN